MAFSRDVMTFNYLFGRSSTRLLLEEFLHFSHILDQEVYTCTDPEYHI